MRANRWFWVISGAVSGFVASYFAGLPIACGWLWPASNMCGFPVMTVVAPIGGLAGGIGGWLIARRNSG